MNEQEEVRMEADFINKVLQKLIGPVHPEAETRIDNVRLKSLKVMGEVAEKLCEEIDDVLFTHRHSHFGSCKQASKEADRILNRIGIKQ